MPHALLRVAMKITVNRLPSGPDVAPVEPASSTPAVVVPAPAASDGPLTYKLEGNAAFKSGAYESAVAFYTLALRYNADPAILGNRSAAHAALGRHSSALGDADLMLYHLRSSPCPDLEIKAHYRRACALKQLELWSLGVAACTRGIALGENGGAGMPHQQLRTLREELQERADEEELRMVAVGDDFRSYLTPVETVSLRLKGGRGVALEAEVPCVDGEATVHFIAACFDMEAARVKLALKGKQLTPQNAARELQKAGRTSKGVGWIAVQVIGEPRSADAYAHPNDIECLMRELGLERAEAERRLLRARGDIVHAVQAADAGL